MYVRNVKLASMGYPDSGSKVYPKLKLSSPRTRSSGKITKTLPLQGCGDKTGTSELQPSPKPPLFLTIYDGNDYEDSMFDLQVGVAPCFLPLYLHSYSTTPFPFFFSLT